MVLVFRVNTLCNFGIEFCVVDTLKIIFILQIVVVCLYCFLIGCSVKNRPFCPKTTQFFVLFILFVHIYNIIYYKRRGERAGE